MVKKVMILMLVAMCAAIEPYAADMPLSKLASMAFIVFECTSIIENAAAAGLPIPAAITETLTMLKRAEKVKPSVATASPPSPTVTINRANSVDIHSDTKPPGQNDSKITINSDSALRDGPLKPS